MQNGVVLPKEKTKKKKKRGGFLYDNFSQTQKLKPKTNGPLPTPQFHRQRALGGGGGEFFFSYFQVSFAFSQGLYCWIQTCWVFFFIDGFVISEM